MKVSLQRAVKYFCKDIPGVRSILKEIHAEFITVMDQADYIFKIYDPLTGAYSKRIKVRTEQDKSCLVYVYCREDNDENIQFDFYEVQDQKLTSIFTSLYGEPVEVKKHREVWELGNLRFHMDSVLGVGDIFEIEVVETHNHQTVEEVVMVEFLKLFEDYLLDQIHGSNEDLVANPSVISSAINASWSGVLRNISSGE